MVYAAVGLERDIYKLHEQRSYSLGSRLQLKKRVAEQNCNDCQSTNAKLED